MSVGISQEPYPGPASSSSEKICDRGFRPTFRSVGLEARRPSAPPPLPPTSLLPGRSRSGRPEGCERPRRPLVQGPHPAPAGTVRGKCRAASAPPGGPRFFCGRVGSAAPLAGPARVGAGTETGAAPRLGRFSAGLLLPFPPPGPLGDALVVARPWSNGGTQGREGPADGWCRFRSLCPGRRRRWTRGTWAGGLSGGGDGASPCKPWDSPCPFPRRGGARDLAGVPGRV